jgi:flagellar hook-length control protein FliK
MLNSQLSQLISSLSDKGLKVVGAEVVYSGLAGDAFKERSDNQQGGTKQQSQSQRRYTAAADISATSAAFAYQAYFDADEEVTEFIA